MTDAQYRVHSHETPISELVGALTGRVKRAQRVAPKLLVRLSLEKAGQEVLRLTRSENISPTGMLLREDTRAIGHWSTEEEFRKVQACLAASASGMVLRLV